MITSTCLQGGLFTIVEKTFEIEFEDFVSKGNRDYITYFCQTSIGDLFVGTYDIKYLGKVCGKITIRGGINMVARGPIHGDEENGTREVREN